MASRRKSNTGNASSAVLMQGHTILSTAIVIMGENSNEGLSPRQIAEYGVENSLLRVPRGRTASYLNQLVQSSLYNSVLSGEPLVYRTAHGNYKANRRGLRRYY